MKNQGAGSLVVSIIHLAGAVASITGVTLLWARDSIDVQRLALWVPTVSISVLIFVAGFTLLCSVLWWLFGWLRDLWESNISVSIIYWSLTGAGSIWLIQRFILLIWASAHLDSLFKT